MNTIVKRKSFYLLKVILVPHFQLWGLLNGNRGFSGTGTVLILLSSVLQYFLSCYFTDMNLLFFVLCRYMNLLQRTLHHPLFTPPSIPGMSLPREAKNLDGSDSKKFTLHPVEFLTGHTHGKSKKSADKGSITNVIVLGMLTQLKEGKYYIEDTTGAAPLDLTDTKFHTGLYTEQCFVLAEGKFEDGIFYVNAMGLCPPESQKVTK